MSTRYRHRAALYIDSSICKQAAKSILRLLRACDDWSWAFSVTPASVSAPRHVWATHWCVSDCLLPSFRHSFIFIFLFSRKPFSERCTVSARGIVLRATHRVRVLMPSGFGCDHSTCDVWALRVPRGRTNTSWSNLNGAKISSFRGHGQQIAFGMIQMIGAVQLLAL